MLTTLAGYRVISANLERSLKSTAAQKQVVRESEYYLAKIEKVKSIDDFLGDTRVFNFAMKAWGLEDMSYAKAFMRKVLTEGIDAKDSFANSLSDTRYKEFAEAFNFERYGETTTVFDRTRQGTVDRYVRQKMEEDAGDQNEGVRLALYFERKAESITSAYGILADKALLKVVETAVGLPATISLLDLDRQAELINERLDIEDLKDPKKLKELLTQFAAMWEIDNPTTAQVTPALLIGQPTEASIGTDLLSSLQNLKLGGL
jgi:hypothetical protein